MNRKLLAGGGVTILCIALLGCGSASASQEAEAQAEAEPRAEVFHPFNGENLDGWKFDDAARPNHWVVGTARVDPEDPSRLIVEPGGDHLVNPAGLTRNLYTERAFGDARIELEVMIPEGSNSGVFVMGEYELQIIDNPPGETEQPDHMDHGAIARVAAPRVYAGKDPGEWQKIVIDFRAPRFDEEGEKTENARFVKVAINGRTVHENVEVEQSTFGALAFEEKPKGPLYLQGNEGPVAFRDISVTPREYP